MAMARAGGPTMGAPTMTASSSCSGGTTPTTPAIDGVWPFIIHATAQSGPFTPSRLVHGELGVTIPIPAKYTILVSNHPRTLALDVGDKRIGLAITDELGLTAQPLFTIHRAVPKPNLRADLKSIARFIRQHSVEVLVIGNPLHADGAPSPQSAKTLAFADALREFLTPNHPNLTIHLLDERLTTRDAHALLGHRSSRADRLDRKDLIDQVAAVLILESFLSGGQPALLPDPDLV